MRVCVTVNDVASCYATHDQIHKAPTVKTLRKVKVSLMLSPIAWIKLMKGKALRKHSLHEKTAAAVLLKLFISGYEWCHNENKFRGLKQNWICNLPYFLMCNVLWFCCYAVQNLSHSLSFSLKCFINVGPCTDWLYLKSNRNSGIFVLKYKVNLNVIVCIGI